MGVSLRQGQFGSYYGNDFNSSDHLVQDQMIMNVEYIYKYLSSKGWTINAISAILGNMHAESSLNPGRWQSENVGNYSGGYGLVQWTPATKYTEWASENGFSDPSEMDVGLARIIYEVENNIQWYGTGDYSGMSFEDFTKSKKSVEYLAVGFLLCYERPADQSESVQNYRTMLAEAWYTYITTEEPPSGGGGGTGGGGSTTKKKDKKFNFILFNRRRRMYG